MPYKTRSKQDVKTPKKAKSTKNKVVDREELSQRETKRAKKADENNLKKININLTVAFGARKVENELFYKSKSRHKSGIFKFEKDPRNAVIFDDIIPAMQ